MIRSDEDRTTEIAKTVLRKGNQPVINRLGDLYSQVDLNLLTTYPELDHFGPREGVRYWGSQYECSGIEPQWPDVRGRRIFAYLKQTKGLPETLRVLGECRQPVVVYGGWVNDAVKKRFSYPSLRLENQPLDVVSVAKTCDLAVLNATHGATAEFLLAGTPILQLPIYLEQRLVAQKTRKLGASLTARPNNRKQIRGSLSALLSKTTYKRSAQRFARRYGARDRAADFAELLEQIQRLAA